MKLIATYEGQTFTRKTARTYTHVIIQKSPASTAWKAVSWAGSMALAVKKLNEFTHNGKEAKVIPVDLGAN